MADQTPNDDPFSEIAFSTYQYGLGQRVANENALIGQLDINRFQNPTFEMLVSGERGGFAGSDIFGSGLAKYPSDLGSNPQYQNIVEIEMWENDSTALEARRKQGMQLITTITDAIRLSSPSKTTFSPDRLAKCKDLLARANAVQIGSRTAEQITARPNAGRNWINQYEASTRFGTTDPDDLADRGIYVIGNGSENEQNLTEQYYDVAVYRNELAKVTDEQALDWCAQCDGYRDYDEMVAQTVALDREQKDAASEVGATDWTNKLTETGTAFLSGAAAAFGQFANTAAGVFGTNFPDMEAFDNSGENSWTEEVMGLVGGTTPSGKRIYLYMPSGVEVKYAQTYESKDFSSMAGLDFVKAIVQRDDKAAAGLGKVFGFTNIKRLEDIPGVKDILGLEEGTLRGLLEARQREIVNPLTVHLYKKQERRKFSFEWIFHPKNMEDVYMVYGIIHLLKKYSHPRRNGGDGRFYDYPNEWKIKFRTYDGQENQFLPKIMRSVITAVDVKYGEDSVFSTFEKIQGRNGSGAPPTKITLKVDFDELELLDQDRFTEPHSV